MFLFLHGFKKPALTSYTNLCRLCFLGTKPVITLHRICWPMDSPKFDTCTYFQESNSGTYDCEADTLHNEHGHH